MTVEPVVPIVVFTPEEIAANEAEDERFHNSLVAFTTGVCGSLDGVCSYGLTIGESYVPFDPDEGDCEEDEDDPTCAQAWVRVVGVSPTGGTTMFDGSECGSLLRVTLEVGVLRCIVIEEEGEAPKAADVLVAAIQTMSDMTAIYRAAMALEVWDAINAGEWVPNGPLGGQFGGVWTFTVEI